MSPDTVRAADRGLGNGAATPTARPRPRWTTWRLTAAALAFAAAFWLVRGFALDAFAVVDESHWLARSANFYVALRQGSAQGTFQTPHPGVPVMWAGAAAFLAKYPAYARDVGRRISDSGETFAETLREHGREPLELLVSARTMLLLLQLATLTAAFAYAAGLFGAPAALAGFALLALDPVHAANSRALHLDATQSAFMLLSLLALLAWAARDPADRRRSRDLLVSGAAAALAILTKTPAIILLAAGPALIAIDAWRRRSAEARSWLAGAVRPLALWCLAGGVLAVLVWPAILDMPGWIATSVYRDLTGHAGGEYDRGPFFAGSRRFRSDAPNVTMIVAEFVWHATPAFWTGLALAVVAAVRRWPPLDRHAARFALGGIALLAAAYFAALVATGNVGSRYLLVPYAWLVVAAGLGWFATTRGITGRARRIAIAGLATLALALQAHGLLTSFPYYLTYVDPLVGHPERVDDVLSLGRGEGLSEAARFLDAMPGAEHATVLTRHGPGAFSYFFRGKVHDLPVEWSETLAEALAESDFVVLCIAQLQQDRPSRTFNEYFLARQPIHVVRMHGVDYARVYRVDGQRAAEELMAAHARAGP